MNKKSISLLILAVCFMLAASPVFAVTTDNQPFRVSGFLDDIVENYSGSQEVMNQSISVNRLAGQDRYKTAKAIAEALNPGAVDSVVLVPGNSFANALPAGVLAAENNAPLLLVGAKAGSSTEYFDYIWSRMKRDGAVYIVADKNTISSDFTSKIKTLGINNVNWISGADKYDTCRLLAEQMNVSSGTPIVVSSGENFPDALAISGYAAREGYPIILVKPGSIKQESLSYIQSVLPQTIYITGGTGAVSAKVESQLKNAVPGANIKRFAGKDRFDTAAQITEHFVAGKAISNIYVTSGLNYPDALAGSVLVAKNQGAMILTDPNKATVPTKQSNYLEQFNTAGQQPTVNIFGGTAVVAETIVTNVKQLITGQSQTDSNNNNTNTLFVNETFNGTAIDYSQSRAVILPESYDGVNKSKLTQLTPKVYEYENANTDVSFSIIGEVRNVTLKIGWWDMRNGMYLRISDGVNMGSLKDTLLTVKYEKEYGLGADSYTTLIIEGDVAYPNGYTEHIKFNQSKALVVPKMLPY